MSFIGGCTLSALVCPLLGGLPSFRVSGSILFFFSETLEDGGGEDTPPPPNDTAHDSDLDHKLSDEVSHTDSDSEDSNQEQPDSDEVKGCVVWVQSLYLGKFGLRVDLY